MPFNLHLLAFEHLLGVALLAGFTLYLSIRLPEPGALRSLRAAMALEAMAGLAAIPLFQEHPRGVLLRLALALFATATLAFLFFAFRTYRERDRRLRAQLEERLRRL